MTLNYIWVAFFLIAFVVALGKLILTGDTEVFAKIISGTFDMSKAAFDISIGLTGTLTLWLGLMKVGEKGGMIRIFSKLIGPFFSKIFPDVPKNHPAIGSMMMNIAANMLGLDNAATPLGLKAMQELQEINPNKETASNPQIMFLVLNTSGLALLPISIMVFRKQLGAANPSDVFIPILISTFCAAFTGFLVVSIYQRINLFNKVVLAYLGGFVAFISTVIYYFRQLPPEKIASVSSVVSNVLLFSIIVGFLTLGLIRKINVYEAFIEGAKEGFQVAVKIIPYLVAMLVGIAVLRSSGALDFIILGIAKLFGWMHLNTDFVPALPTALMKPLSGSGARGMMIETMKSFGPDSFAGRVACTIQGSADTTFYILALYFGSVGIKRTRYAVACGLLTDLAGAIAGILIAYLFFH